MIDLDAIKAREVAATPGPWDLDVWGGGDFCVNEINGRYIEATQADYDFIESARQDIPNLVAEVERLRCGFNVSFNKPVQEAYIDGMRLTLTCYAVPEQYEVFDGDQQVGYLRLRHGEFRVDAPECGGETIYEAEPDGDGMFEPEERRRYLLEAIKAIKGYILKQKLEGEGDPL